MGRGLKELANNFFSGISDLSITQSDFKRLALPCRVVLIMENKTNFSNITSFLTLPEMQGTIAVFGQGFQISTLKECKWLQEKRIVYWGDIDVHGFQILSQLRSYFQHTESLMMDFETLREFDSFRVDGPAALEQKLPYLTEEESTLYRYLASLKDRNRLEQERITHSFAVKNLSKVFL